MVAAISKAESALLCIIRSLDAQQLRLLCARAGYLESTYIAKSL